MTPRYFTIPTLLLATILSMITTGTRAQLSTNPRPDPQLPLIELLESDAPSAEKAITCKRLAVVGDAAAVPALAALLPDTELVSWARIALEAIPGPEANRALREAMGTLEGRNLIGVINSISYRRDAAAVDGLIQRLGDADTDVASAAAVALGHIGGASSTKALQQALTAGSQVVRDAAAEGCNLLAESLLADGKASDAAAIYDQVRSAGVSKQRVRVATRGAILARGSAGIPLLVEQLRSSDKGLFNTGLGTARELPGRDVTEALIAELGQATPERQALLIFALADRNDAAALPAVLAATANGSTSVRIAAVGMLRRVGNVSCVPALLDVALDTDEELAQAAKTAIEGLGGKEVDAALVARLTQADGGLRTLLIELVGKRRITTAVPALIDAAKDPEATVRAAALLALGSTVGPDDLSVLIAPVIRPIHAEDTPIAQRALRAAAVRMPDREACAKQLTTAMAPTSIETKCAVLEILAAMGGENALEAMSVAAKDPDDKLQDTGSRLMGEWMTNDAAPALLDLAKTAPAEKYRIRAMRGYIRIARQFVMADEERVAVCRAAMETATRDAERQLVLEVMERYPSLAMLRLAVGLAKDPAMKEGATRVSLAIAQKIGSSADARALLEQVGHDPVEIEIVKAQYGAGDQIKDVTEVLRRHVSDFSLIVLPSASYNTAFGGDPAPGVVKQLKVEYRLDGKPGQASFPENASIFLPTPNR